MNRQIVAAAIVAACVAPALAGPAVYNALPSGSTVNVIRGTAPNQVYSAMGAKYRLSNSNFDMSLDAGGGTSTGANFIANNLGNISQLNNVQWSFTLSNDVTNGLTFTMQRVDSSGNLTGTLFNLQWGDTLVDTTTATDKRRVQLNSLNAHYASFNSLHLVAQTTRNDPNNPDPDAGVSFSNMQFTSTTLGNASFGSGAITSPPNSVLEKWLVAGGDLRSHNWTVNGIVSMFRNGATSGGDESIRFIIDGKNVSIIPLPTGAALAFAGLGIVGIRRRRA